MAGLDHAAFGRLMAIIKSSDPVEVPVAGRVALVDADDADSVAQYTWYLRQGYAVANIGGKCVSMHRLLMQPGADREVDHADGNRLNNCRSNLRICDRVENCRNQHTVRGRSRFKGVRRSLGYWRAAIKVKGKSINLGIFPTERLAAKAYDAAAIQHFGRFAKTNADLNLY